MCTDRTEHQQYNVILQQTWPVLSTFQQDMLKFALTLRMYSPTVHMFHQVSALSPLSTATHSHHTVFCYLVYASVCACTRVSNPGFPEPPNPVNVDIFQFPKPKFRFNRGLWGHKTALLFVKLCELGIFSAICCTFCTIHCRSV